MNNPLYQVRLAIMDWCDRRGLRYLSIHGENNLQSVIVFERDRSRLQALLEFATPLATEAGIYLERKPVRGGAIFALSLAALAEATWEILMKQQLTGYNCRVAGALGRRPGLPTRTEFQASLNEALQGIATPTNNQPIDVFAKFAKALQILGNSLHVGPLQDQLSSRGIKWKKSDDGMSIILYVVNAQTKAPQPIARISAETLDNPSEFEEQLTEMIDLARGQAPGTQKQKQEEVRNNEKAIRDIARAMGPQEQSQAEQELNQLQSVATVNPVSPQQPAPGAVADPNMV